MMISSWGELALKLQAESRPVRAVQLIGHDFDNRFRLPAMHRGKDAVRLLPGPGVGVRTVLCPMLALRYGTMVDQGSKRAHPAGCDRPDAQAGMPVILDNVRIISLFSYNICVNSTVRAPRFPDVHGATARALAPDRATPWNSNEPPGIVPGKVNISNGKEKWPSTSPPATMRVKAR
jgi:hypothetical protein